MDITVLVALIIVLSGSTWISGRLKKNGFSPSKRFVFGCLYALVGYLLILLFRVVFDDFEAVKDKLVGWRAWGIIIFFMLITGVGFVNVNTVREQE